MLATYISDRIGQVLFLAGPRQCGTRGGRENPFKRVHIFVIKRKLSGISGKRGGGKVAVSMPGSFILSMETVKINMISFICVFSSSKTSL